MKHEPKFFSYLMLDTIYLKKDVKANGGSISLRMRSKENKLPEGGLYIAEINGNVYSMELLGVHTDGRFKCKEAIYSKHTIVGITN